MISGPINPNGTYFLVSEEWRGIITDAFPQAEFAVQRELVSLQTFG